MPQSLVNNYIHIIFSTKNRLPLIDNNIKDELFSYIGGICKNLECNPIIIWRLQKSCSHTMLTISENCTYEINRRTKITLF